MSLVTEYLPYGSLICYLENNRHKVDTRRMLLFASQICKVSLQHCSWTGSTSKVRPKGRDESARVSRGWSTCSPCVMCTETSQPETSW